VLLSRIIKEALRELESNYRRSEETYLTEGDVVASLLCSIRNLLSEDSGHLTVHAQLRPYKRTREGCMILKQVGKEIKWTAQTKANEGQLFDIAVTHLNTQHWRETHTKALEDQYRNQTTKKQGAELRYWRMLSCPVEAFKAAIEIKIRLWGNHQNIKSDIQKLAKLREVNNDCLAYCLVIDRAQNSRRVKELTEYAEKRNVHLSIPSFTTS